MKNWVLILVSGLVSGILSSGVYYGINKTYFDPLPGICFGILMLVVISITSHPSPAWKKAVFIVISILAYIAAFWSAICSMGLFPFQGNCSEIGLCSNQFYFGIFIGGLVGGLILSMAAKLLFNLFSISQIIKLVVISGLLGFVGIFAGPALRWVLFAVEFIRLGGGVYQGGDTLSIFVVWQIGMIALCYYFLKQNNKLTFNVRI